MKFVQQIDHSNWNAPFDAATQQEATALLEAGVVLHFPNLAFQLDNEEVKLRSPHVIGKSKNVAYNPANDKLSGTVLEGAEAERLKGMISRYAAQTKKMLAALLPKYHPGLAQARTSFRPVEIAGRASSWRKDDSRLHVDSFPATPTRGKRILRIFNNVNPEKPRVWRVGEPFEDAAKRFYPKLTRQAPGSALLQTLFRITKSPRSEYDHFMLQMHDRMKEDTNYQQTVTQHTQEFTPGSTWLVFSDQVSHAAMSGQHQFEQTYLLPVDAMQDSNTSPLRTLERIAGRKLA